MRLATMPIGMFMKTIQRQKQTTAEYHAHMQYAKRTRNGRFLRLDKFQRYGEAD